MKLNRTLLKQLLPGLIPLFLFIIADGIWGTKVGLIVAVSFGLIELIYTFIRNRKLEKFVLIDTALIVVLGTLSYMLNRTLFFTLKPALIEGIIAVIIGFSGFSRKNLVAAMTERYTQGTALADANPVFEKRMRNSLRIFFFITLFHIGLIIYSVFFLSLAAWAFISSVFFYILIGGYLVFEIVRNRIIRKSGPRREFLPVVDEEGTTVDILSRRRCHTGRKKPLHPVVHLQLFDKKGRLYLQKRGDDKRIQPEKWDTAVGGHVSYRETIEDALNRETEEEIGISGIDSRFITSYIWESDVERELVHLYSAVTDTVPVPDPEETDGGRFWPLSEIEQNLGTGTFTPNFEYEFRAFPDLFVKNT